MKKLAVLLSLSVVGCVFAPKKPWQERGEGVDMGGGPYDTTYLLRIDPATVDSGGLTALTQWANEVELRFVRDVEVDGVVWQPIRTSPAAFEPNRYGSGGDSMLFTGVALAGWTWKHAVTGDSSRMVESLRGLWILTHVAGKGVLCRAAFPASKDDEFGWPDAWTGRDPGYVGTTAAGQVSDPLRNGQLPEMRWYTRGTKDQLTGLVLGLACAWKTATATTTDPALSVRLKQIISQIVVDVVEHLRAHGWRIRDARGMNDTSADDVDDLLKLAVLALARTVGLPDVEPEYQREFARFVQLADTLGAFDRYNNFQSYYAHGLRAARSYSIWLLDEDQTHKAAMVTYAQAHWRRWTVQHGNSWLAWLWFAMSGITPDAEGLRALHELRLKPFRLWSSPLAGRWKPPSFTAATFNTTAAWALPVYLRKPTTYSVWQKEPWDAGELPWDTLGLGESTGVDYLSAYWLGRAHGFIPQ